MRWSKIKNIIILILLITNGCLLLMVGVQTWRSHTMESETGEKVVQLLEENGIDYLPDAVPDQLTLPAVRLELAELGEPQAALFLGPITGSDISNARSIYRSDLGTALCTQPGSMMIRFASGALPLDGKDPEGVAQELFARLSAQVLLSQKEEEGGLTTLTFTQCWNGAPVLGWGGSLSCTATEVTTLSLHLLTGEAEEQLSTELPLNGSTALVRLLEALNEDGYVCTRVRDLYEGYTTSGSGVITLLPVWFAETDPWPYRFQIDGTSGAVTALESERAPVQ